MRGLRQIHRRQSRHGAALPRRPARKREYQLHRQRAPVNFPMEPPPVCLPQPRASPLAEIPNGSNKILRVLPSARRITPPVPAQSHSLRPRKLRAGVLLAACAVWLVGTTLCGSKTAAEMHLPQHAGPVGQAHSHQHAGHHHDSGKSDDQSDKDADCCDSIQSAPAQSLASSTALLVPPSFDYFWMLDTTYVDAQLAGLFSSKVDFTTGPPGLDPFAEHFLQRCLLSQAPPVLA